jgi:hypothetical protein
MSGVTITVLTVTLEDREDGGLRVYSDDLPGLILSGPNKPAVFESIPQAIQVLFSHRGFEGVTVRHATPLAEVLKRESPRDMDVHVQHQQFVVEMRKLAA